MNSAGSHRYGAVLVWFLGLAIFTASVAPSPQITLRTVLKVGKEMTDIRIQCQHYFRNYASEVTPDDVYTRETSLKVKEDFLSSLIYTCSNSAKQAPGTGASKKATYHRAIIGMTGYMREYIDEDSANEDKWKELKPVKGRIRNYIPARGQALLELIDLQAKKKLVEDRENLFRDYKTLCEKERNIFEDAAFAKWNRILKTTQDEDAFTDTHGKYSQQYEECMQRQ